MIVVIPTLTFWPATGNFRVPSHGAPTTVTAVEEHLVVECLRLFLQKIAVVLRIVFGLPG
jgi:hypothetical protein